MSKGKQFLLIELLSLWSSKKKAKSQHALLLLPSCKGRAIFLMKHAVHRLLYSIYPHENFTTASSV